MMWPSTQLMVARFTKVDITEVQRHLMSMQMVEKGEWVDESTRNDVV